MTLLDIRYSYKQVFEQYKNMDLQSTGLKDIIYLNPFHCQKMGLQNSELLGAVHKQDEQPAAFSLRSLNEAGRSRWWCWKLCSADLNPSGIYLGEKITVEANLKLMKSLFQKIYFSSCNVKYAKIQAKCEILVGCENTPSTFGEGSTLHQCNVNKINHVTGQTSGLFKWAVFRPQRGS